MKIRKGFVSNSSSSSFICEICGNAEEGYDMSYDEIDFASCENGHIFCRDHIAPMTEAGAKSILAKIKEYPKQVDEDFLEAEEADQITALMELNLRYFSSSTMSEMGYEELPEELCPICTLQAMSDSDILTYILKEHGSTREFVIEKARKEFGNYQNFSDSIS